MGAIRKGAGTVPAQAGRAVLVAGTLTILGLYLTDLSEIVLTRVAEGGMADLVRVSARANGNGSGSFTITSNNAGDTSTIEWFILSDLQGLS